MTNYMSPIKNPEGRTLHDQLHEGLMHRTECLNTFFATLNLRIHVEFLNDESGKEKDRWCRRLCYWLNFVLLLIIFQAIFYFNLALVANWRLLPEFWSPKFFPTRHGDQNGRSLERCFCQNLEFWFSFSFPKLMGQWDNGKWNRMLFRVR